MSIYATLSPTQIEYVVGHADPAVVVLEGTDQLARWESVLAGGRHNIKKVIVIDDAATPESELFLSWSALASAGAAYRSANAVEVDARWQGISPNQPVTILYTSGTPGNHKAVVLSHAKVLYEAARPTTTPATDEPATTPTYLPFAHLATTHPGPSPPP